MQILYKTGDCTVAFAASELAAYLKKMLPELTVETAMKVPSRQGSADIPPVESGGHAFRIAVGVDAGLPAGMDCFRVKIQERGGLITGNNERSVLLGVYDYLRHLGCRFLAPSRECERIPRIEPELLPADYEKRASYFHRGVCIEGADSFENIVDFIDWLPKVGYNAFFLQFKTPYIFMARYYQHRNNPYREESPEAFTAGDARHYMELVEAEIKKRGLILHKVGHGWTGEVLGYESVSWDAVMETPPRFRSAAERSRDEKNAAHCAAAMEAPPRLRSGAERSRDEKNAAHCAAAMETPPRRESELDLHREQQWAACIDGKRELWRGVPTNTNLCYSQRDGVDRFAALVVEYAEQNPQVDYLHVWLADAYNNVCECEECVKTTVSDQYVSLLNEIDRRLTDKGLNTRLVFLLYQELLWPPVKERLLNPERFVLMFAPISRTFEKSYSLAGIPEKLPPFVRNRITLPTSLGENLAFLKGWQSQFLTSNYPDRNPAPGIAAPSHLRSNVDGFVYDYPLGRAHYGDFGYVHIAEVISEDIKKLDEMGLNGYVSCQELRVTFPNALPNYVMGYTLFDREADVQELIREYFEAAYGDRAQQVMEYLEKLSELSSCDYMNGKGERKNAAMAARMREVIQCCREMDVKNIMHCAAANVFFEILEYHRNYVLRMADAVRLLAEGNTEAAMESWREMRDYICRGEEEFQPYLDVYRVLEVTKNYTGFRESEENHEA